MEVGRKPPAELQRLATAREIADDDNEEESEEEQEESARGCVDGAVGLAAAEQDPREQLLRARCSTSR